MLLVGLGNPGPSYALNRHNVGFMVADVLQDHFEFEPFKRKGDSLVTSGTINSIPVTLLKPMTYINCSGVPTQNYARFYKILPEDMIVIHDDLNLSLGNIKLKQGGGSGGHNGLKSLDAHVGQNYWRLRIGIGHPGHKDAVNGYVLKDFPKSEQEELIQLLQKIALEAPLLLQKNMALFSNNVLLNR